MSLISEVTKAGETIFKRVFAERQTRRGEAREAKTQPTPESVRLVNERNTERALAIKLNHNFVDGDWHLVLTYAGNPPEPDAAQKDLQRFQRVMNREYRKRGVALKYITATEYLNDVRIHHHIVMSAGMTLEEIQSAWTHGLIRPTPLNTHGDYRRLAEYLVKETRRRLRPEETIGLKRYRCSRTITTPETRREEVRVTELLDPQPPRGWYIDKDSYFEGVNPVTGRVYVEYVLLPTVPDTKYRKGLRRKWIKTQWSVMEKCKPRSLGVNAWLRDNWEYQTALDTEGEGLYDDDHQAD